MMAKKWGEKKNTATCVEHECVSWLFSTFYKFAQSEWCTERLEVDTDETCTVTVIMVCSAVA